eukprot:g46027.t1
MLGKWAKKWQNEYDVGKCDVTKDVLALEGVQKKFARMITGKKGLESAFLQSQCLLHKDLMQGLMLIALRQDFQPFLRKSCLRQLLTNQITDSSGFWPFNEQDRFKQLRGTLKSGMALSGGVPLIGPRQPQMELTNIDVNDFVEGDERSFEIWHEREDSVRKYTLQARTVNIKISWVKDITGIQQCFSLPAWNPPEFVEKLADCTAEMGQTVKLACLVIGNPKPVVTWYKDGKLVEVDPHHIIIEDEDGSCTLILDTLTAADSGQYMCYAASAAGNANTLGKIIVQVPPRFVSHLRNIPFVENEDTQFVCTIEAAPTPQI